MNRQWISRGLLAVIFLQAGVLAAEYLNSVYPLWTGREIRLQTVPIDPRSMFRGNYVRLNYKISTVSVPDSMAAKTLRHNEIVYVKLRPAENNLYEIDSVSFSQPKQGLFIRGRIRFPFATAESGTLRVSYGIEAFFVPGEKALELEKQLRNGGTAIVMLADNGKAALKDVVR
jgi:uncharacterized membrane-anchored protein